jgi:hypothetical protein
MGSSRTDDGFPARSGESPSDRSGPTSNSRRCGRTCSRSTGKEEPQHAILDELEWRRLDAHSSPAARVHPPADLVRAELELELEGSSSRLGSTSMRSERLGIEHLRGWIPSLEILSAVIDLRQGCRSCAIAARPRLLDLVAQAGWSRAAIDAVGGAPDLDRELAALGFE